MQLNLLSGESLKAVMSGAQSTVLPKALIEYLENGIPKTAWVTLNGVTAVTLLAGSEHDARVVTAVSILNTDDAAVTVTLTHVTSAATNTLDAKTLQVLDKLEIRNQTTVTDSSGNVKLGFQSTTTTFTGDVTLSGGKDIIFEGTTGQPEIKIPDNLADALSMKITGGADLITFDTSTGAIIIAFGATVRVNLLGDTQIGNATTDLVAFHGSTPTDQCPAYTQTFATADRTHAARTATALTVADGGRHERRHNRSDHSRCVSHRCGSGISGGDQQSNRRSGRHGRSCECHRR